MRLNTIEAYSAMLRYIKLHYELYDLTLAELLSSMTPLESGEVLDDAKWCDWIELLNKMKSNEIIEEGEK